MRPRPHRFVGGGGLRGRRSGACYSRFGPWARLWQAPTTRVAIDGRLGLGPAAEKRPMAFHYYRSAPPRRLASSPSQRVRKQINLAFSWRRDSFRCAHSGSLWHCIG